MHVLACRSSRKTRHTTVILSLTIFALFFSMTIYAVTWLLSTQSGSLMSLITSGIVLLHGCNIYMGIDSLQQRVEDYTQLQSRTGTAALTINVCGAPWYPASTVLSHSCMLFIDYARRCYCMLEGVRRLAWKSSRLGGLRCLLVGNLR